jgi:hypothetical protein
MSENLTGLGDNDFAGIDRKRREELRDRNPINDAEVTLERDKASLGGRRVAMKPLLCLDLEGTLISNAVSQLPRPGLYAFLQKVRELFDLVLYTSVSSKRASEIQQLLVSEDLVPAWFANLDIIRPEKTIKPKSACGRKDAFLLDDQPGVIAPGEDDWWIPIAEYLPPYSDDDQQLADSLDRLQRLVCISDTHSRHRGSPTDPDEVFKEVDRQRDSGELTENLLQENSYLTDLDDQGNLVKRPGRKNR